MTEQQISELATKVAASLVLHNLPKRLNQAGVSPVYVNGLVREAGKHVQEGIEAYLREFGELGN